MIFLDFDGTVVDVWPRFYSVFFSAIGVKPLSFEQYKEYKLSYTRDSLVAQSFGLELPADYFQKKEHFLEDPEYLKLDRLLIPKNVLCSFLELEKVMFLVKRHNEENFVSQLESFGMTKYNYAVIKNGSKKEYVEKNYPFENSIIIGDSLFDLEVGELPYVFPYMVDYGLSSKDAFASLNINYQWLKKPEDLASLMSRIIIENDKK